MRLVSLVLLLPHLTKVTSYGGSHPTGGDPIPPTQRPAQTTTHVTPSAMQCEEYEQLGSPTGNNETYCLATVDKIWQEQRWNANGPCFCAPPNVRVVDVDTILDCGPPPRYCLNLDAIATPHPTMPFQCGDNEVPGNPDGNVDPLCSSHLGLSKIGRSSPCKCVPGAARFDGVKGCRFLHNGKCPTTGSLRDDPTFPGVAKEDKCLNKHDLCDFWARIGHCDNNRRYMERNCALACTTDDSCGQRSLRPYEFWNCGPDRKHPHCDDWVRNGDCKRNYLFMKDNCGRECANAELHRSDPEVLVRNCLPDV